MNRYKETLLDRVVHGGNMVMFGRSLLANDPALHAWVIEETSFLDTACSFNERVFCVVNDLSAVPLCPISGAPCRFKNYFKGYRQTNSRAHAVVQDVKYELTDDDIEYLRDLDPTSVSKLCNRMKNTNPQLYLRVMAHTKDFGDARLVERVYCIVHDIPNRLEKTFRDFTKGYVEGSGHNEVAEELLTYAARVGSSDVRHGSKVKTFLRRNRMVHADLYDLPAEEQGNLFVVCPVLGIRCLNLKLPYVEGILKIKWDDFRSQYPQHKMT